jgi:ribosome-binding ATPase
MKISLAGLPQSGKTTIFNALTQTQAAAGAFRGSPADAGVAIVKVDDERVDRLSQIYSPKKTVFANVEIADCAAVGDRKSVV